MISTKTNSYNKGIFFVPLLIFVLQLIGCASTTVEEVDSGPIFYPSLPNSPRIQFLKAFGTERDLGGTSSFTDFVLGEKTGQDTIVEKPYGVNLADGKIFVVDTRGNGYVIFDLVTNKTKHVKPGGAAFMKKPINIFIDAQGNRFVTDTGRDQVLMFDLNDKFVRAYGVKKQFKPTDVLIVDDKMFVVDIAHHKIQVLSVNSGETLYTFSKAGSKDGELFHPTNIKLSPQGNLYISDTSNYRIQVFSLDGTYIKTIGKIGSGLGQFARPKGIALDQDSRLYVVDAAFQNVQVFNPDGELLLFFASGGGRDRLYLPTDITIDYANAALFQQYADPKFKLEYVILVANQFGPNKVNVYGYGQMQGMDYDGAL